MSRFCLVAAIVAVASVGWPAHAQRSPVLGPKPLPPHITPRVQESECGVYRGFYGPMDFRGADPHDRRLVEEFHLDMEMQTFLGGRLSGKDRSGTGPVVGGFVYTLNSFPNHPVALSLIEQLGRRVGSEEPQGTRPLECWYVRAFKLVPDDPVVWLMYGVYLANRSRTDEALKQLDRAEPEVRNNGALLHQLGLGYLAAKQYSKTQIAAMRAQRLGFPLDSLQRQLRALGQWNDGLQISFTKEMDAEAAAVNAEAAAAAASAGAAK